MEALSPERAARTATGIAVAAGLVALTTVIVYPLKGVAPAISLGVGARLLPDVDVRMVAQRGGESSASAS
jgi:hypothetical protein